MHTVADARSLILSHCQPLPAALASLLPDVLGQTLAPHVASDLDVPPFDRAVMDGYAVRRADLAAGHAVLQVVEEITAGVVPKHPLHAGQASRIMTGAPLPDGADAVVMVERSKLLDDGRVRLDDQPRPEQHILRRGAEIRSGEVVVRAGTVLRPVELGMLALLGQTQVRLIPRPRVAVLATGDELVEPPALPGPGQIRNSNAPMLLAQAQRAGAIVQPLGIARDRHDSLAPLIERGLHSAEVLLLTGGVSAGKLDLVPGVLKDLGVIAHLHKVKLKPGKPLLFGTHEAASGKRLVFGLPGNPVSSLVCFELFVRPALRMLAGHHAEPATLRLPLLEGTMQKSDRPTYLPARIETDGVRPVPWGGSSDLRAYLQANALLVLPEGEARYESGDEVEVMRLV